MPTLFEDEFEKEDIHGIEDDIHNTANLIDQANASNFVTKNWIRTLITEKVNQQAKQRMTNINAKMENISIAPGEYGKFANWGQDIYLEEKSFPHLFPFGIGGYMSTVLDGKETEMGFSNYVHHRLLYVDSRYRNCTTYVFFLLLV